jgi:type I restriction enzyme, S subunit
LTVSSAVALGEVALVNPRFTSRPPTESAITFVPMSAVSEQGTLSPRLEERPYGAVARGFTPFLQGDLLVAKITPCFENGKIALGTLPTEVGVGSTEFHVVRPDRSRIDPAYLLQVLRLDRVRRMGEMRMTGSAGQRRVPAEFLETLPIPLPGMDEQRRIARTLDLVQSIRSKEAALIEKVGEVEQSLFRKEFGDPVANPRGWETATLPSVCRLASGKTPPKSVAEYWKGDIPWFSGKDLKAGDLWDSQDHVSSSAVLEVKLSLLPIDTAVILVRGMALAHTVPIAVLRSPATINQDLKALLPIDGLDTDFLVACLRTQEGRLLALASESAHGTKRLDSTALERVPVLLPPLHLQQGFAAAAAQIRLLRQRLARRGAAMEELFGTLQSRVFEGEA